MNKNRIITILSVLFMVAGFAILFYPDISNLQKSLAHGAILREYDRMVAGLSPEHIEQQLQTAAAHNTHLGALSPHMPLLLGNIAPLPDGYSSMLYVEGVMAWLDIPVINTSLPVLHGTEPEVLARGAGHFEGTAFPTGGDSTHSVLMTHSGMPGTRLFSDLHLLGYGDVFFVSVLGQRLAYEVDQIITVLPHEIEWLRVTPGMDHITLITCTPITVNTHRLLVRGTRIQYIPYMAEEIVPVAMSTGFQVRAVGFAAFILIYFLLWRARRRQTTIEILS